MKEYNYFYAKQPIPKSQFISCVPENWEEEVDEYGEYSYGYYKAIEIEEEELEGDSGDFLSGSWLNKADDWRKDE